MFVSANRRRAGSVAASTVIGLALAAALAAPSSASAASPPITTPPITTAPITTPPTTTPPITTAPITTEPAPEAPPQALVDFESVTSMGDPSRAAAPLTVATPATATPSAVNSAAITGKRQTFTRGTALAWASDTFEWYWSGSKMTSSSTWQADGYIFPNTVTLKGVKRTLDSSSEHLWRGTASIGAGVVTPWGTVDVYSTTVTDYFTLKPGKLTHSTN